MSIRAADLRSFGNLLESLINIEIRNSSDLADWYAKAQVIKNMATSNADLSNVVPHFVWHYLSDADIRLKDEEYAKIQNKDILDTIKLLKNGQAP